MLIPAGQKNLASKQDITSLIEINEAVRVSKFSCFKHLQRVSLNVHNFKSNFTIQDVTSKNGPGVKYISGHSVLRWCYSLFPCSADSNSNHLKQLGTFFWLAAINQAVCSAVKPFDIPPTRVHKSFKSGNQESKRCKCVEKSTSLLLGGNPGLIKVTK